MASMMKDSVDSGLTPCNTWVTNAYLYHKHPDVRKRGLPREFCLVPVVDLAKLDEWAKALPSSKKRKGAESKRSQIPKKPKVLDAGKAKLSDAKGKEKAQEEGPPLKSPGAKRAGAKKTEPKQPGKEKVTVTKMRGKPTAAKPRQPATKAGVAKGAKRKAPAPKAKPSKGEIVTHVPNDPAKKLWLSEEELPGPSSKEKKSKEVSFAWLQECQKYFCFGPNRYIDIPVGMIIPPPADLCFRSLDLAHVQQIWSQMITNPTEAPHPADVIPCLKLDGKLLQFKDTKEDWQRLQDHIEGGTVDFVAISGQHSAEAAKCILREAQQDVSLEPRANLLSKRSCRILSQDTPRKIMATLSRNANLRSKEFVASHVDTVLHMRKQWKNLGSPRKGVRGATKIDPRFRVSYGPSVF
jgi:hypothetical protein